MEDVIIPPVPSKHKHEKLEEGFLKAEELPAFEDEELGEVKVKEKKPEFVQLPFEVVHKVIRATCLIALILWFVIIVFLSITTNSSPFNTLIGLSPVLLTIIITYILVDKYHLESGFLMVFPIIFTGLLFMLGLANLLEGIDYETLSAVNIVFGLLFEAAIIVHYNVLRRKKKVKPEKAKEEKKEEKKLIIKLEDEEGLKSFVSSIEDKSKAINAAIGRVYSVKHRGAEPLRKKIKIDADHYNEFNELKNENPEKRKATAIRLLRKIKERLELFQRPENEVFDDSELTELVHIERNKDGKEAIIDVLMHNDKDPVGAYYQGALDFCEEALKILEEKK